MFFLGNSRRADCDNLSKCVLDGLNGIAFSDDKQTIKLTVNKYVCRERQGVLVKIKEDNRRMELNLEQQKHMISLAPFDLEPNYFERNAHVYEIIKNSKVYTTETA